MNKNRIEAFSDGVFAVAITLLIFNVRPTPGKTTTLEALRDALPQVLSFLLSFVIVGVYWVAHHSMLQFVRAVDRRLLWLNLLLLLVVVFIPFPASLLGQRPGDPLAVMIYGVNLVLVNGFGTVLWLYATSKEALVVPGLPRQFRWFTAMLHAAPMVVYGIAIAVAAWNVWVSLVLYALVPSFFVLPNPWLEKRLANALAGTGR